MKRTLKTRYKQMKKYGTIQSETSSVNNILNESERYTNTVDVIEKYESQKKSLMILIMED